ncbi:MAG TPA: A/G-specific adenine glycosylase, partial [Prolixibacteraceae bacterium]|nr:A/G-specific adenine glycosylase [Prolixibacteraceae bacterium]
MNTIFFSNKILKWYNINKRELPWRKTKNPYFIWISEVILQQTRVEQGKQYYLKFIDSFPDITSLAAASEDEILKTWQGLGYYSRARNLHKGAKQIVQNYNGIFPNKYHELLKISGIGPYTAAAIASIAFNIAKAAIDGNVYRVLSRVFEINAPIDSSTGKKTFDTLANKLIDNKQPGNYNQALMELGALICKPRNPICENCPLQNNCLAHKNYSIS